ncbi:aggregation factor core [Thalassococcus lentus]|uniref:Aggregation factor core n=1 Tax=Thalassococcus lentus TaxID=1210524 RepID=A0ABT4XVU6_9RHOB|nr:aggregation factor core [Thalassococcus lentus]MDA7426012.1 aggregation factor core [Thalassococcus lentus]
MKIIVPALAVVVAMATTATADIQARFIEGAPKDRFEFTNTGDCTLGASQIKLNLGESSAGLIFDTTAAGAGVEVFQPLEIVAGAELLNVVPVLKDGDNTALLELRGLNPGQSVAFTIDVDDTLGGREITVSGSEILGARVSLTGAETSDGRFDERGVATLTLPACLS